MIQAWRSSGVVDSSTILASICSGVTVIPISAARPAWIRASMSRSITTGASWSVPAAELSVWVCCDASALVIRPDATSAFTRAIACWIRQTSMAPRSAKSSRVIVWPFTLAAGARCSL